MNGTRVPSSRSATVGSPDDAVFLERYRHGALVVRQGSPIRPIQAPRHAPPIGAQLCTAACKLYGGSIVEGDPAVSVCGVDRGRERIEQLSECPLALACACFSLVTDRADGTSLAVGECFIVLLPVAQSQSQ